MKVQVKKIDAVKTQLIVEVTGEIVKNKFEDVFKKVTKEAKVKGFRPGHAPREVIEKNYSDIVHEQVLKELIPQVYDEALKQQAIEAVALPEVTDVKLDGDKLSFKATVEVYPDIDPGNYKGIKIEFQKIVVSQDELKRQLDTIKESRKIAGLDDAFACSVGYPSLAEFEKALERQLAVQKDNAQRQEIENKIVESITKDKDIKLPQSLVDKQVDEMMRRTKVDLAMRGIPQETIAEHKQKLLQEIEPQARKEVKTYMVLAAIAKKEGIALDDHMPRNVMELLYKQASWIVKE